MSPPFPSPPLTLVALGPEHPDLPALLDDARTRGVLIAHTHCLPQAMRWLESLAPDALVCTADRIPKQECPIWLWDGKPASLAALVNALRPPPSSGAQRFGALQTLELERKVFLIHRPQVAVQLPAVEWRLLICLLKQQGRAATRQELLEQAWPSQLAPKARSVDQVVSRLRRMLAPLGIGGQLVSLRGLGYRFDATARPDQDHMAGTA